MAIDVSQLSDLLYTRSENDTVPLPSGKVANVREMTGHEQRNFMNRAKLTNGTAIQELLAACTLSMDGVDLPTDEKERSKYVLDLLSADRRALMFGIRRHSLGDEFMFTTQCPQCKSKETWEVNLSDKDAFPVTPCPNGDTRQHVYESKIRTGLTIQFNLMDGNAEMTILRKGEAMDILTDLEMRRPKALASVTNTKDGTTSDQWVPIQLAKVSDSLIAELRRVIREQEGDIRTKVKVICKKCESEVEFDLLQVPDFMTPSVIS